MSGAPSSSANPFLPLPQPGFIPAPDPGGLLGTVRRANPFEDGILLSPQDQAALAAAPRRAAGTEVAVQAKPVFPWLPHFDLPLGYEFRGPDHMFETFDDGSNQYIYRGGPAWPYLHARVDPATQSPDFGAASRVLDRHFLPGVTASEAIKPAQADAARVNQSGAPYGISWSNSNTLIGDFTKRQYGRRVGDPRTWGYDSGLASPPSPLDPFAPVD